MSCIFLDLGCFSVKKMPLFLHVIPSSVWQLSHVLLNTVRFGSHKEINNMQFDLNRRELTYLLNHINYFIWY